MKKKDGAGYDPADAALHLSLALEQSKGAIAALTNLRQQFIDAGWSEPAAEQMVYALMLQQAKAS